MSFKLRDYQELAHSEAVNHFRSGGRSIVFTAPPRSGKGSMIANKAAKAARKGHQVLIHVHKAELVMEIKKRLNTQFGMDCGVLMRGHPVQKDNLIQVGSVMTMIRRNLDWLYPVVFMVDECHRLPSPSQAKIHKYFKEKCNPYLIGFTATLYREDKKDFVPYFDKVIQVTTWRAQLERGVLVPTIVKAPKSVSLENIKLKMSASGMDFDEEELATRFMEDRVMTALYSKWMEYTGGKMQSIAFSVNQKHNRAACEFFRNKGVSAEYVDDKTPDKERKDIMERFYKGLFCDNPIMILFNISIFSEGIDCPTVKCVVGNMATKSFTKYVQSFSRGAGAMLVDKDNRKWICDFFKVPHGSLGEIGEWLKLPNGKFYKEKVLILDFGGNTERHGMLEDYDIMPPDLTGKRKEEGVAPTRTCPECLQVCYAVHKACPSCGFVFPPPKKDGKQLHADEVDWDTVDKDQSLVKKIINLKAKQAERSETQWLRIVALIKGYDKCWLWARVSERGEYKQEGVEVWGNKPGTFENYLENLEKEKGTFPIYERLKSKRLSI